MPCSFRPRGWPRYLVGALTTLSLTLALVAVPAAASSPQSAARQPSPGASIDFGCANPANHVQTAVVEPAASTLATSSVRCYGKARGDDNTRRPYAAAAPEGYGPADIQSAYGLSGATSDGKTVAIVDAYDDPNAEADLATYRSTFGLPECSSVNGCFQKVNQDGDTTTYPPADAGWAEEISLDLDAVSATCPDCHILLVEANSANTTDLMTAEDTAATAEGVVAVSNSWGGGEDASILDADSHFDHPGVAITASSGDSGYGASWPASSQYVTGVGGTTLTKASGDRGWEETTWSGAGSGCSAYEPKPAWQTDSGCDHRTIADVSAVADPSTGLAVYDTYNDGSQGADGWVQVGGTSLSSPVIASVYALAGNAQSTTYGSYPYDHTSALNDVTSGSNGTCDTAYLCTAGTGYDGPTGLGTPNGTGGF